MLACPAGTTESKLLLGHLSFPDLSPHPGVFLFSTYLPHLSPPILMGLSMTVDLVPPLGL